MNTLQKLQLGSLPIRRAAEYTWNNFTGRGEIPVRPYYVALDVTYRCNLKCVHCSLWDRPDGEEEMTLDEMKEVVLKLKNWLNLPAIDILGGEAFLRPETMQLIRFATEQGMFIHIVTNGTMLTEKVARELIDLKIHKVAISIDGFQAETHDRTRGVKGAFKRTLGGVERLKQLKDELGGTTRIAIHTILNASTLNEIPDILDWVVEKGLDEMHLVPLDQNVGGIEYGTNGFNFEEEWFHRNPLWIRDIDNLERIIGYMIQKKSEGYPIADPVTYLQHTIPYFRDPRGIQHERPCQAGAEVVTITPKGGMSFCPFEEPIGNLRDSDPAALWESKQAIEARKKINACTKKCFIPFCSWNEKERMGRFYEMFVKPNLPASLQPTVR
jgi:MoaA/NifB/PqqE/SkfB family radical SAM enzyme